MVVHRIVVCVVVGLAGTLLAAEAAEKVRAALGRAAPKLGAEFQPLAPGSFTAALTKGLANCDRIDLEVHVRDGGAVDVFAYPSVGGERLDARKAPDRPALLARLAATDAAPFAWAAEGEAPVHARATLRWDDASGPAELERILLAAPSLDKHVAGLLPLLRPALSEAELTAKLKEAGAADEAGRARILATLAPYLPEVTPSATPGKSAFVKLTLNGRGTALDAFRFRVPAGEGERRLVWAFAYPPGTAKGWFIVPVAGEAPKFVRFHRGGKYAGTDVPAGHATLLQRTETALRPGAEYVIWFQFKVETPVDVYVALGCFPFARSDRDTPAALEEALGLKPQR